MCRNSTLPSPAGVCAKAVITVGIMNHRVILIQRKKALDEEQRRKIENNEVEK